MKKYSLSLLFLLPLYLLAQAQRSVTIAGSVTDSKAEPVEGATVHLLNSQFTTMTDKSGNFRITNIAPGIYILQISAIGHNSLQKELNALEDMTNQQYSLSSEAKVLETIVVSAEKREALLQRVPLSITAFSSTRVQQFRLWNTKDLTALVPNLYSANSGDDRNVTSIRGITTTSYDPAVATNIDGVNQFSLDTYIANLFDVERIEVLRGPQGTLYGRNAMSGVINIITKQPTNKTHGFAELNLGNYGLQRYSAGLRLPVINNKLYVGAAIMFNKREGYYTNEFDSSPFEDQQGITGNYYLRYIINPHWQVTLNAKHQDNRNKGAFPMVVGAEAAIENPFKLNQNAQAEMHDNTVNGSLSINYTGTGFNFVSQTAYQSNYRYYDAPLDGDFSPIDGVSIINNYGKDYNRVKVFTQELRFSSPASATALQWTGGLYFFHQDNPVKQATYFGADADLLGIPDENFYLINTNKGKTTGGAIFGQATYSINDKLDLIAGIRFDVEKKDYNVMGEYQKTPDPAFVTQPDTSATVDYDAISPKLGIAYKINSGSKLHILYSRGYRTGGLTQLSSDPSQPPLYPYQPEYSNNIEAGIKNTFYENKLRVNATAFLTLVSDAQLPTLVLPDAITVIRNAGELSSKGIELEIGTTPLNGLQLDYSIGYTDAHYTSGKLSQGGSEVELDGKKQIFTPEITSMLAAQYSFLILEKSQLKAVVRGEWIYLGKQYFDAMNTIAQSPYHLLNTRLGLEAKNFGIYFWGRNMGDTKYIAYAYDFGAVHLGNPKTYGVTLLGRF